MTAVWVTTEQTKGFKNRMASNDFLARRNNERQELFFFPTLKMVSDGASQV